MGLPFKGARVRWNDRRIMPFVIYGFLLASAQTVNQQTLGFMVIDKLKSRRPRPPPSREWR
jgi:hypothetical protein